MKQKIVSVVLALSMTAGLCLTGCGNEEAKVSEEQTKESSQVAQESSANGESSEEAVEELEPYTVTYWIRCDDSADAEMVDEAFNEKLAEYLPNTTVEFVRVSGSEYKDKWNKALAAGEKIDIGWSANWVNNVSNDIAMGVVNDIEDALNTYGQGIIEAIGGEAVVDMHRYADGNVYFVPCWQGLAAQRSAVYISQDVADLLPEGWMEEAQEIAFANNKFDAETQAKLYDKVEEIFVIAEENEMLDNGAYGTLHRWGVSNNTVLWNDYKVSVAQNESGVFSVYKWFGSEVHHLEVERNRKWIENGWTVEIDGVTKDWTDGTYILMEEQALDKNWLEARESSWEMDLDGFLLNPNFVFKTGYETGIAFPNTGENLERSMMVADLLYTNAELYQLLVYGIEGTHYTKNADGTITVPENPTYSGPANWTVGSCINSLVKDASQLTQYQDIKALEETAIVNPIAGFSFDKSNLQTENANLDALRPVAGDDIKKTTADNWHTVYNDYIEQLEDAGMDTYFNEFVKQLTAYVEDNNLGTVEVVENPVWE